MKNKKAAEIGYKFLEWLAPYCRRAEIAGSVRRGKPDVKDLEIVAIPWVEMHQEMGLFGPVGQPAEVSWLEETLAHDLPPGWEPGGKNGPKLKRFIHTSGLVCELYMATAESWGGALAIRTGPAEFSQALVIRARRIGMQVSGGYYLHRHAARIGPDGNAIPCERGEHCIMIVPCYEEIEFFEALGVEWREPGGRSGQLSVVSNQ